MKSNNLEARIARFQKIFRDSDLKHPLLATIDVPKKSMDLIVAHAEQYLSAVLKLDSIYRGKALISAFEIQGRDIQNISPTGMILPKRDTAIEYNLLLRSYYKMICSLYFADRLKDCHTPAHIRIKWSQSQSTDLERPRHAPEEMHFDSWSGYSSHGMTFLLPVLGDVQGNRVRFFDPPDQFEEKWLVNNTKPSAEIRHNLFKHINVVPKYGQLVIMDTALLHQTYRERESSIRFSIDNIFRSHLFLPFDEAIEIERQKELTPLSDLTDLGARTFYLCDHTDSDRKDSKGGSVDPTQCHFIRIN
jgi:hypothetical protein